MSDSLETKILNRLHLLGIEELKTVERLNLLNGSCINLECLLPNGKTGKILDDSKKYLGNQAERTDSGRRYGIAADEDQIAVYSYGCGGRDAKLEIWVKL